MLGIRKTIPIVFLSIFLLTSSVMYSIPFAYANGEAADLSLGQSDLYSSTSNLSGNSLNAPLNSITDSSGNLWVSDANNNRVLRYDSGFGNGATASIVLGQPNVLSNSAGISDAELSSPRGLGIDSSGNLWVADSANNRVLRYSSSFSNGQSADFVLGQADFISNSPNRGSGSASNTLFSPQGIFVDGLDIWVADSANNRVLKFIDPANTDDSADFVLGQADFISNTSGLSSTSLFNPTGIAVDGTTIWVADTENNRTLKFNDPVGTDITADLVLGQPNFISNANNNLSVTASTLNKPQGIAVSGTTIWVADGSNNRLLQYNNPAINGNAASVVLGHAVLTEGDPNFGGIDAASLFSPQSVFVSGGEVWTADSANNRVLKYTTLTTGASAALVIGQSNFVSNTSGSGSLSASSMSLSRGVAIDSSGNTWVADSANNRVLRHSSGFSNGQNADLVLGQNDFTSNAPNRGGGVTANTLHSPRDLGFDNNGNLWVADSNNNRVLRYALGSGFTNGQNADLVLGQPDFTTNLPNQGNGIGLDTMNFPQGILVLFVPSDGSNPAFQAVGVADTGNDRALLFFGPSTNGESATLALGGSGTVSDSTMFGPTDLAAGSGGIWISDTENNRVLRFDPGAGLNAFSVLGQPDFTSNSAGVSDSELNSPTRMTIDSSGNLWVVDSGNNRVVAFSPSDSTTVDGQSALHVIGQQNFNTNGANSPSLSDSTLSNPNGVAVTDDGGLVLWVADSSNNRVLRYSGLVVETPEIVDSDGDGVIDSQDVCPNTPENTSVDDNGCPFEGPPPDSSEILSAIADAKAMIMDGLSTILQTLDNLRNDVEGIRGDLTNVALNVDDIQQHVWDIHDSIDNPDYGLEEIKNEVRIIESTVLDNTNDLQAIQDQLTEIQIQTGDISQKIDILITRHDGDEKYLVLTTLNGIPVDSSVDQIVIITKKSETTTLSSGDYSFTSLEDGLYELDLDKKAVKGDIKAIVLVVSHTQNDGTISNGSILFEDKVEKNLSQ
jgi:sugar lactone lactonase YvrE